MNGRPLRFLGVATLVWTAGRAAMLLSAGDAPASLPRLLIPVAVARPVAANKISPPPVVMSARLAETAIASATIRTVTQRVVSRPMPTLAMSLRPATATSSPPPSLAPATARSTPDRSIGPFAAPLPGRATPPRRWSGGAWLLVRDGDGLTTGLNGGQLGGSQAGARLAYALDPARRVAIVGRVTGALHGRGGETSIGLEWQPSRLPVRLVVERRFALDGGRGGPAAGVVAGTGPAPLAFGLDLETYGEAGVVRRDRAEPFADGIARATRRLFHAGPIAVDIGAGAWGGAQRGVGRLDIGPTLGARVGIGDRSLRALADWRQRVAGNARPGSGPALTIGLDF